MLARRRAVPVADPWQDGHYGWRACCFLLLLLPTWWRRYQMHEMALAEGVLGVVLDASEGRVVRRVRLRVGTLQQVMPDSLRFCFLLAAQGTPAAEAELELVEIPARVRCKLCGCESEVDELPLACRACGAFDVDVAAGDEVLVDGVERDDGWRWRPTEAGDDVPARVRVPEQHLKDHALAAAEWSDMATRAPTPMRNRRHQATAATDAARDRLILVAPRSVSEATLAMCRVFCQQLADSAGATVALRLADDDSVAGSDPAVSVDADTVFAPGQPVSAAPMGSAPFAWRDDGRPDWAAMWTSFCELALYGGPPHRGEANALRAAPDGDAPVAVAEMPAALAEIRRGIWETTGLSAEPAEGGWMTITCQSAKMAAWLCATIILENVAARCEEERLLVPASASFRIEDEVKSVVTVVAKTYHYWEQHVGSAS